MMIDPSGLDGIDMRKWLRDSIYVFSGYGHAVVDSAKSMLTSGPIFQIYDSVGDIQNWRTNGYIHASNQAYERKIGGFKNGVAHFWNGLSGEDPEAFGHALGTIGVEIVIAKGGFIAWSRVGSVDTIVLGRVGRYDVLANQTGAKYFQISDTLWGKMSDSQRWAANVKFLDKAIASRASIRLSEWVKPGQIRNMPGFFGRELRYLESKGYRLGNGGMYMFKK